MRALHCLSPILATCLVLSIQVGTLCGQDRVSSARNISPQHLTTEDGLANGFTRVVFQDRRGFIWFGDRYGVSFYDGNSFEYHRIGKVESIHEDAAGNLWIHHVDKLSRFDPETARFSNPLQHFLEFSDGRLLSVQQDAKTGQIWLLFNKEGNSDVVSKMAKLDTLEPTIHDVVEVGDVFYKSRCVVVSDGSLWATSQDETQVVAVELATKQSSVHDLAASNSEVEAICITGTQTVWAVTAGGILHQIETDGAVFNYPFVQTDGKSGVIAAGSTPPICDDESGHVWIATDGHGLFRFDPANQTFVNYRAASDDQSLCSDRLSGVFRDAAGFIWVNSQGSGVDRFDPSGSIFDLLTHEPENPNSLGNSSVWTIHQDSEGMMWFGHETGIDRYDSRTGQFEHFRADIDDPDSISIGRNVSVVFEDSRREIWVGSWNGGLNRFDRDTEKFHHYRHDEEDKENSLQSDRISAIIEDRAGRLWVGCSRGLSQYDRAADCFKPTKIADVDDPDFVERFYIRTIYEMPDQPDVLWIGGWEDLGLLRYDVNSGAFRRYVNQPDDPTSLSNDIIRVIHAGSDGSMWCGTADGLNLFDRDTETFTRYSPADGLPGNLVCGILEDQDARLWISTNRGISRFIPSEQQFDNFGLSDGIQSLGFTQRSYYQDSDGNMFFGGREGVNRFHPTQVARKSYASPIRLTSFKLFNKRAAPDASSPLPKQIWATEQIKLPYGQDVFSIEFDAVDFLGRSNKRYRYRLEGFDENWIELTSGQSQSATYTNLPPGSYQFVANVADSLGAWSEQTARVQIIVEPAWWETAFFRTMAALGLVVLGLGCYRLRIRSYEQKAQTLARFNQALKQEVHDRERAEEEFRAVEEKYTSFFTDAKEAVFISKATGQLLDINPAGVQLFGYDSREELLAADTSSQLYGDLQTRNVLYDQIKKNGYVKDYETTMRRKDGQLLFLILSATAVRDEKGNLVEVRGIVYDLTRKKELESQLFQSQKMDAIGTLAAGIAHDFNNLISAIVANTELMAMNNVPSSKEIGAIHMACEHASQLTNQILMFSRQDSPAIGGQPTSMAAVVRDVEKLLRTTLPKRVHLACDLSDDAYVLADPAQLQQITMNLCTNALQAIRGDQSGEVNISLHSRTLQGESAGQFRRLDGPHVELRVRDTGEGISVEAKDRLFDPFFTTRKQGTGIGLSVVHGIVEELQGRIEVESEPGKGSCFVVTLPSTESPTVVTIEGGGHRVLLAEDDQILRSALCEMLVFSGYDVTAAADGQEALVQLEASPTDFDVIITDQRMPRMTGVELIRAARRLRTDIPVLLMTGYTDQDSTLLKPPFIQRLLHKPFKASGLHDQIQNVLKEQADSVVGSRTSPLAD